MGMQIKAPKRRLNWIFLVIVVLPVLAAVVYYGLIASDVYTSESRFVIRSPERQTGSPIGALLRGTGFAKAQDDSYTVQDFILSRDALTALNTKLGLGRAFADPKVDRFSRFGALDGDASFEALYRFYQKKVSVQLDPTSSISTLTVRAFTAADATNANRLLLENSEALVNRLNERGRQDLIRYAASEVARAEEKARETSLTVSKYRSTQSVVDPERQAAAELQQTTKLQDELLASRSQLAQLKATAPENPQIQALRLRIRLLKQEIASQNVKITGGGRSLSNKAAEFQRLTLEAEFANKQLASAYISLESARNEAQRQQVYLERIVEPSVPDVAQEPRRLRGVLLTLIICLMLYAIASLLVAGVREHAS
jgi:capsular polysaccharide transport system permease protein